MESLTKSQRGLLYLLYGLTTLMVIFSMLAVLNVGESGYQQCIQDKCQRKGQEFCSKQREISNCCQGAAGELAVVEGKLTCVFA